MTESGAVPDAASPGPRPRVVVLRGHSANPWDLRPWELLGDRFDVRVVVTDDNEYAVDGIALPLARVRSRRGHLPPGRLGRAAALAIGDRYERLEDELRGVDIVHAAELGSWFSAQAAGLRERLGFRLALTVWETIPFLGAYRWPRERRYRQQVLTHADLLLPATERARRTLLLEGAEPARTVLLYPGIDTERFTASATNTDSPSGHLILSAGRLVWEKGHQDVLRAVAALHRGLLGPVPPVRLLIVGSGPEEKRLRRHAEELGVAAITEFRATVPYDQMPALYRQASALVLASLPRKGWEEQFGMVLAEALASGTPIVAVRSGAIPEVVGGDGTLVEPGDWYAIALALRDGPLSRPAAQRAAHDPERVRRFSVQAAAGRLAERYSELLA